ncbi:MAG: hypothetical protein KGL93_13805 [Gemmatimonadota bacterium]|nr:hypothetical protein [Gemmatimonadota bacterium]
MPTILACLPDPLFRAAQRAIPDLVRVGSLAEARAIIRTAPVDGLICDPAAESDGTAGGLFWLATDHPDLRITLYTVLDPGVARSLVRLAAAGIADVVLFGFEDSAERWHEVVARTAVSEAVRRALRTLEPVFVRVEPPLRYVLQEAFLSPRKFRTANRVAAAAATDRRGVYRRLNAAGVRTVRDWLHWARLVNAFALLRDPGRSPAEVAQLVGYAGRAELAARVRGLSGWPLEALRAEVTLDAFLAVMAERLVSDAGPAGRPDGCDASAGAAATPTEMRRRA